MTDFLDDVAFPYGDPVGSALYDVLTSSFGYVDQVQKKALLAGIPPSEVDWSGSADIVWISVLDTAALKGKLRLLIDKIIESDPPVGIRIKELLSDTPVLPSAPPPDAPALGGADWQGEPERQTGAEPTLLEISFLQRGLELASSVVKLVVTVERGTRSWGTAWLIKPNTLLTNHHVLYDDDPGNSGKPPGDGKPVKNVEIWFGYEQEFGGANRKPLIIQGHVAAIKGSKDDDWATIEFDPADAPPGLTPIDLADTAVTGVDERVYIIQHPGGLPKKIGMIHNTVRFADETIVQYLTDTAKGSSGSPVFDEQWKVVALHHWGEVTKLDGGVTEIRNQGRTIKKVIDGLKTAGVL